ncbi:MAG: GNAT family N-acetyltransferase [Oscillospiraceae bacterium]
MFEVLLGKDANEEFISDVLTIDEVVYPSNMRGTKKSVRDRYLKNKDSYILIYENKDLVGYMCFFPVNANFYHEILFSDEMFDDNIKAQDIQAYDKENNLFLISVAILPSHQNGIAIKLMVASFKDFLKEKIANGQYINSITAVAISNAGEGLLERLNFEKIKSIEENHFLYCCTADRLERLLK